MLVLCQFIHTAPLINCHISGARSGYIHSHNKALLQTSSKLRILSCSAQSLILCSQPVHIAAFCPFSGPQSYNKVISLHRMRSVQECCKRRGQCPANGLLNHNGVRRVGRIAAVLTPSICDVAHAIRSCFLIGLIQWSSPSGSDASLPR